MAVSANSTFNSGVQGVPGVGADFDIFETSSTPKYAVGTQFTRSDGAHFVYSHFGAVVGSGGVIVAQDISESGSAYATTTTTGRIYASGSTTAIAGETIRPGTVGSHYVEIKAGGITADRFAGGYFDTVIGTGQFFQYRIRGNTVSSAKTSGAQHTYYLELYEPLQQTLDGTTTMRIIGSKYANLESATAATDTFLAGVTTCSHAASTYGWVRRFGTGGPVAIRVGAVPGALGSAIALSAGFCGKIAQLTSTTPIIGYASDLTIIGGLASVETI
jgi:hypothetical protein